jgi:hypothetical protein
LMALHTYLRSFYEKPPQTSPVYSVEMKRRTDDISCKTTRAGTLQRGNRCMLGMSTCFSVHEHLDYMDLRTCRYT